MGHYRGTDSALACFQHLLADFQELKTYFSVPGTPSYLQKGLVWAEMLSKKFVHASFNGIRSKFIAPLKLLIN